LDSNQDRSANGLEFTLQRAEAKVNQVHSPIDEFPTPAAKPLLSFKNRLMSGA